MVLLVPRGRLADVGDASLVGGAAGAAAVATIGAKIPAWFLCKAFVS